MLWCEEFNCAFAIFVLYEYGIMAKIVGTYVASLLLFFGVLVSDWVFCCVYMQYCSIRLLCICVSTRKFTNSLCVGICAYFCIPVVYAEGNVFVLFLCLVPESLRQVQFHCQRARGSWSVHLYNCDVFLLLLLF